MPQNYQKPEHAETLKRLLPRLGYALNEDGQPPAPFDIRTGAAKISTVYLLLATHNPTEKQQTLVAKFDRPDRVEQEWQSIERLRKQRDEGLQIPREFVIPLEGNTPRDGVILFQAVEDASQHRQAESMLDLLARQLGNNQANCIEALDRALEAFDRFYDSTKSTLTYAQGDQPLRWADVFPKLEDRQEDLTQAAEFRWPQLRWGRDQLDIPEFGPRLFPNPILTLQDRRSKPTGPLKLTRVHGDANLTNMLVLVDRDHSVIGIRVIDLEKVSDYQSPAIDLAMMETDFWREVFVEVATQFQLSHTQSRQAMVAIIDALDGRTEGIVPVEGVPNQLFNHAAQVVHHLRTKAKALIRDQDESSVPLEYLWALYHTHAQMLRLPQIQEQPPKFKVAALGSSLALQTLMEIEAGHYARGGSRQFPEEPPSVNPR